MDFPLEPPGAFKLSPSPSTDSLGRFFHQALMNRIDVNKNQDFFSAGIQALMPSISEDVSGTVAANQSETPAGKKKAPRSRNKAVSKVQLTNNSDLQSILAIPGSAQQTVVPAYSLDQVMAEVPLTSSTASCHLPNDGQGMSSVNMGENPQASSAQQLAQVPIMTQTASGVANSVLPIVPSVEQGASKAANHSVRQEAQMSSEFSLFMKPSPQAPFSDSVSAILSQPSTYVSTHATATPSSDNKRKAPAAYGTETPTKRRQSLNHQGVITPIAQPLPMMDGAYSLHSPAQSIQTPARSVQTSAHVFQTPQQIPIDPVLHYGISPPSGVVAFGASIKAGICAAIKLIVAEAKIEGTALSMMLTDGPGTDFSGPETGARIKQATRDRFTEVTAMNPGSDRQAFLNGAYKLLQGLLREAEESGSAFGKELLLGPITGAETAQAKKTMVGMYKEVMASYESPPRVDDTGRAVQVQQTPTRVRRVRNNHGTALAGSPHIPNNGTILTSSPHLPGYPSPIPAASFHGPQPTSHPATSSPMHSLPTLAMTGYTNPSPPTLNTIPFNPQPKKTPAPRKSRARKASTTPAITPNGQPTTTTTVAKGGGGAGGGGQCIPKIAYHFADAAFYMQVNAKAGQQPHYIRVPRGTDAAEAALGRFLALAREMGILGEGEVPPAEFVFRVWEGVEEGLAGLRGLLARE